MYTQKNCNHLPSQSRAIALDHSRLGLDSGQILPTQNNPIAHLHHTYAGSVLAELPKFDFML